MSPMIDIRVCEIDGCSRAHWGRGFCRAHYTRYLRYGDPRPDQPVQEKSPQAPLCTVLNCANNPKAKGLCTGHYERLNRLGTALPEVPLQPNRVDAPCAVDGCTRTHYAKGRCNLHYRRVKYQGYIEPPPPPPRPKCQIATCGFPVRARGYCNTHYARLKSGDVKADQPIRRRGGTCDLSACNRPHYSLGFCHPHYQQRVSMPRRRALEESADGVTNATQLQARIDYYGAKCWMCGKSWTCIDHVKPLAVGGSNWPSNLRPACRSCNARKQHRWLGPARLAEVF